ncbi:DUF58 domain-containing protein [Pseudoxanthomonas yeongjuensis]|uniref:DUF58 domain-containing protein n=1 Tax=Pseudoxanthomonas yeongjuensis TaxID=377616 RepID=UPI0013916CD4|nr:DUF58 domain-containing protein [Pseudoxanthomonas yeongjuensis]KAF1717504.1 DUF58 domain-containing protein [Pseudoxanthomonas yeongjuensis]
MLPTLRERLAARAALLAHPRSSETLPVEFDRRRVYVLPTRFGLFFAALLFAMLLGALNYNNNPAFLLALLLGATGLASLIAAHLQLSGLRVDAISAEPVAAGSVLSLHVALSTADTRMRRGLQLRCREAHATAPPMSVEPVVATLELATERRGWIEPGRIRVSTTQPLGLAMAWSWAWPDAPLLVYPSAEPQGPPLPSGNGGASHARLHPAGDDVHHLRGYRSGDPRRAIAWKPSARRDTLLVREYEQPLAIEVILDWTTLSPLAYEQRIHRLAHWVDLAEREGRRYRLLLPGQPALGPAHGSAHRHLCLRALALLPDAGDRSWP